MKNRSNDKSAEEAGDGMLLEPKLHKTSAHFLTAFEAALICLYILGLFVSVMYIDKDLPRGLMIKDEDSNPDRFIAERAQRDLLILTKIGPRITGSHENEVLTVDILMRKLTKIKEEANKVHNLEIDLQVISGSYYLNYKPFGGYNVYGNVQNIVVKLSGFSDNGKGILINAHFDSVPTSPGGSDDGINCAVMLEVLRKLTMSSKRLKNNIFFLLNGAEETPLQASHGFIAHHKWRKDVEILINLEAAGSGGKEILFQSGPGHSWLLNYYKNVPHPHGQVAGEEIFQSNFIPSDTDFRIFRDFGDMIGYDMAFARNGYRYHTNFDDFENIPIGSYQHVGDNVLHLVKSLGNAEELENPPKDASKKKAVYYDVFGKFMICYDEQTALILNLSIIAASLIVFHVTLKKFKIKLNKSLLIHISIVDGCIVIGWILSIGCAFFIGWMLDCFNRTMSWYSKPWVLIGLYIIPSVVASAIPILLLNNYKPGKFGPNVQSQLISTANRLIWTFLLIIATCMRLRSAYVLMIPVLFNVIFFTLITLFNQHYTVKLWRVIYVIINCIPVIMIMYQAILVLSLFIPITGRIGSDRNPEFIVGVITSLVTILSSSFFIHFIITLKNPKITFLPLIITIITIGIVLSPAGFQYSGDHFVPTPQRYMIYHTNRIVHNEHQQIIKEDAGYFVINLDRNAPSILSPYIDGIDNKKLNVEECKNILVCGLPLPSPRLLGIMKEQLWVPAKSPSLFEKPTLKLLGTTDLSDTVKRFNFEIFGPPHINVYFSPKDKIELSKIDLSSDIPENVAKWNNRSIYFINYNWGKTKTGLQFYIDLEAPKNWKNKPMLDIAISGKEFSETIFSSGFQEFINQFPSWTNVAPAVSTFESWVY